MFVLWTTKRDDNTVYRVIDMHTNEKQTCIGSDEVENIIFSLDEEGSQFALVESM